MILQRQSWVNYKFMVFINSISNNPYIKILHSFHFGSVIWVYKKYNPSAQNVRAYFPLTRKASLCLSFLKETEHISGCSLHIHTQQQALNFYLNIITHLICLCKPERLRMMHLFLQIHYCGVKGIKLIF